MKSKRFAGRPGQFKPKLKPEAEPIEPEIPDLPDLPVEDAEDEPVPEEHDIDLGPVVSAAEPTEAAISRIRTIAEAVETNVRTDDNHNEPDVVEFNPPDRHVLSLPPKESDGVSPLESGEVNELRLSISVHMAGSASRTSSTVMSFLRYVSGGAFKVNQPMPNIPAGVGNCNISSVVGGKAYGNITLEVSTAQSMGDALRRTVNRMKNGGWIKKS